MKRKTPEGKVEIIKKIPEKKRQEELFKLYKECLEASKHLSPQDQLCYNWGSFRKALIDSEYVKFVLSKEGKVIGLVLGTTNLDKAKIAYINPHYFSEWLKKHPHGRKILYFTFLGIRPEYQDVGYFFLLVQALIKYCERKKYHAGLDFSSSISELPQMIQKVIDTLYKKGVINSAGVYRKLGYQEYGVFELTESLRE
jgi:ribosomal protein S18 acetylase RimI-like enzyme